MTDLPDYYRGDLRIVVAPDGPTDALVASLRGLSIADLDVDVVVAADAGAVGKNRAAEVPRLDYLAFVSTATPDPVALIPAAIAALRGDLSAGLVGWSPAGRAEAEPDLFVDGRCLVARHSAFHAVSGFDPSFGPVLEDLDLAWRMWLAGYRVFSAGPTPDGSVPLAPDDVELPERTRGLLASVLDSSSMSPDDGRLGRVAKAIAAGRRPSIQLTRQRGDGEVLPLAHDSIRRWATATPTAAGILDVVERHGAPDRAGARRRIAVVTADTLTAQMAGPAIRALQIARRLAPDHDVVLATTDRCEITVDGFEARAVGERSLRELERWCDVLVFQGWILHSRKPLQDSHKVIVADIYDPMHLEQLEQAYDAPGERGRYDTIRRTADVMTEQMERADFMLCASAKQRDLWIGALAGLGRVNPVTYDRDNALRHLLAVVPFGVGDDPPVQTRSAIRGSIAGIGPDDKVVLWGGGVYNWFDPVTLVRAIDVLRRTVPEVRLLFLGMKHPNPGVPQMRAATETQTVAQELGLVGTHVFFNHQWVDFDDRQNFLLDADVGVSTHFDHIETEFSFRTRILDYLWAGLPIVATDGDGFADLIRDEGLGLVVPPEDVDALAAALGAVLTDEVQAAECRANIARISPDLRWEHCLEPLVEFCREPKRSADLCCPDLSERARQAAMPTSRQRDVALAMSYLRAGSPQVVAERLLGRVRANRR